MQLSGLKKWTRYRMTNYIVSGLVFSGLLIGQTSCATDTNLYDSEGVSDPDALLMQLIDGTITSGTISFHSIPPSFVQEGHRLYTRYGCAVCHGLEGRGDGPVASTLRPGPRDFREGGAYRMGHDIVRIAGTLETGMPGSPSMPPFPHIKAAERFKIAMYIVSLQSDAINPTVDSKGSGQ